MSNYDCLTCGACCIADYGDVSYVYLSEEDFDRLDEIEQEQLVHEEWSPERLIVHRALKVGWDGDGNCRCQALKGKIGVEVECDIYERRPRACERFPAGGSSCREARKQVFGSER